MQNWRDFLFGTRTKKVLLSLISLCLCFGVFANFSAREGQPPKRQMDQNSNLIQLPAYHVDKVSALDEKDLPIAKKNHASLEQNFSKPKAELTVRNPVGGITPEMRKQAQERYREKYAAETQVMDAAASILPEQTSKAQDVTPVLKSQDADLQSLNHISDTLQDKVIEEKPQPKSKKEILAGVYESSLKQTSGAALASTSPAGQSAPLSTKSTVKTSSQSNADVSPVDDVKQFYRHIQIHAIEASRSDNALLKKLTDKDEYPSPLYKYLPEIEGKHAILDELEALYRYPPDTMLDKPNQLQTNMQLGENGSIVFDIEDGALVNGEGADLAIWSSLPKESLRVFVFMDSSAGEPFELPPCANTKEGLPQCNEVATPAWLEGQVPNHLKLFDLSAIDFQYARSIELKAAPEQKLSLDSILPLHIQ